MAQVDMGSPTSWLQLLKEPDGKMFGLGSHYV